MEHAEFWMVVVLVLWMFDGMIDGDGVLASVLVLLFGGCSIQLIGFDMDSEMNNGSIL